MPDARRSDARVALVCGVAGLVCGVLWLAAVVFGVRALRGGVPLPPTVRREAVAGLVLGVLGLAFTLGVTWWVARTGFFPDEP